MNKKLTCRHYKTGKAVSVTISGGHIGEINQISSTISDNLPFILPGLVDLQVNGYGGFDFNTPPIDTVNIEKIVNEFYKQGITSFSPTIVTNNTEKINEILASLNYICNNHPEINISIAGIHLEGPFISPNEGPRGAHDPKYIIKPDINLFRNWFDQSGKRIKIITLSPEWPESIQFINECKKENIIVSIGHTSATTSQIKEAVAAGASMSTHLGNGAHAVLPRHPNYLWDQLAEDELWATVIADGIHVPDSFLKVVFRIKKKHSILISDCTKFTGLPPGTYDSPIGGEVILEAGGRLYMKNNNKLLAGSARTLYDCVNYLISSGLCSFQEAWDMASVFPMKLIFPEIIYGLEQGAVADLVIGDLLENKVRIIETYKNGEKVFSV